MKLSKLFHWLYFSVMALPLVVAPIFALYTTNKNANFDYSVSITNDVIENVNLKNIIDNGYPDALYNYSVVGTSTAYYDDDLVCIVFSNIDDVGCEGRYAIDYDFINNHQYFLSIDVKTSTPHASNTEAMFGIGTDNDELLYEVDIFTDGVFHNYRYISTCYGDANYGHLYINFYDSEESITSYYFNKFQIFDLTSIFGSGNEPTLIECDDIFTLDYYWSHLDYYYDYVIGTDTVNYSDTDIGSQFIYSMYNCIDKYFNYDKVINFGDLYVWLNTTFFSGQAPLGFFIFWHLLEYWLLTSLLWLLFDVLLYVPMLAHRWLDKASLS